MPTYEYRCLNCHRRFNLFFTYAEYGTKPAHCTHCGSANVTRRIGRVRIARSTDSRLDDMSDTADFDGLEENPRELGRMMRSMSRETGEDMPPEFDEVVSRLEKGQSPEDIERDLPDLGLDEADDGLGGGMDDALDD